VERLTIARDGQLLRGAPGAQARTPYRMQYGVTGDHANCHDNLRAALRELGIEPDSLPTAFNFFMNVEVLADGKLKILPPTCRKGDSMVLRAEMDLAIALSACPAATCNDGPPRSLAFEAGQ
jgi:uncharacterized protein YcgI (DUF1989 family)